jgi:hypothetical protein
LLTCHFSAQILGLVTVLVGLASSGLYVLVKLRMPPKTTPAKSIDDPALAAQIAKLNQIRLGVNQLLLFLVAATSITGFGDLSSVALCFTAVVPFEVAIGTGFGLSSTFVIGSAVSMLEVYMLWHQKKMAKKGLGPDAKLGEIENKAPMQDVRGPTDTGTEKNGGGYFSGGSRFSKEVSDI